MRNISDLFSRQFELHTSKYEGEKHLCVLQLIINLYACKIQQVQRINTYFILLTSDSKYIYSKHK